MHKTLTLLTFIAATLAQPALAEKAAQPGLFIKPGETVAFRVIDGQPAAAHSLGTDDAVAEGEVKASFSADGENLTVTNHSGVALNYQAFVARDANDKGKRTSVCTLMPEIFVLENWQGGLPGIRLANFSPAGDKTGCF